MSACNCDGEYIYDRGAVMYTKGCPLHGNCTLCCEELGTHWEGEDWVCVGCEESVMEVA